MPGHSGEECSIRVDVNSEMVYYEPYGSGYTWTIPSGVTEVYVSAYHIANKTQFWDGNYYMDIEYDTNKEPVVTPDPGHQGEVS